MRPMARVERFFERLVERPTARVFGTRIQPIQVLRRVEREMESGRRHSGGRNVAPDRFAVRLSPDDVEGLGPLDALAEELASGALAFARAHRLTLNDRPSVSIEPESRVARGDVEVAAAFTARVPRASSADAEAGGTRVYEAPIVVAPVAALALEEPGRVRREVPINAHPTTIGRGSDCDVVLADAHASRRHARLDVRGGLLVLTDLNSTNGTRVNGHRVREVVLGVGDRIEVGQTVMRVVQPESSRAA